MQAMIHIISNDPPQLKVESWNEPLRDFITDCLQKEPKDRPTADELLKSHKALWAKAKDGKYLVSSLKLKDHSVKILRSSPDKSTQASFSLENSMISNKSQIQWNFDLDEHD